MPQRANNTSAHHTHPLAQHGVGIPYAVQGGFHIGRQYPTMGRHALWNRHHHSGRYDVVILVGIKAKNGFIDKLARAVGHAPYTAVAVLHRGREIARLERRTHPLHLAFRYAGIKYQRLSTATHSAVEGTDKHLAFA